jgi:hypothetical protein
MRHGRWLTGLLLLLLLLSLFYLGVGESPEHKPPVLFFSLIIAYIIPVFSYITAKAQEALSELRSILDLDEESFRRTQMRLDSTSLRHVALSLGAGFLAGCAHISLIQGLTVVEISAMLTSFNGVLTALGTVVVWTVMMTVVVMLIRQTVLFGQLGKYHVRISLFDTRKLRPFARVSIFSSLAIIGALALFPLIGFENGLNLVESLPGVIALLAPLATMFIIPVWPVHRRLAALKERELASVSARCFIFKTTPARSLAIAPQFFVRIDPFVGAGFGVALGSGNQGQFSGNHDRRGNFYQLIGFAFAVTIHQLEAFSLCCEIGASPIGRHN